MIIDLNQILSTFNIDYEIAKGNNKLGEASLPKQFKFLCHFDYVLSFLRFFAEHKIK